MGFNNAGLTAILTAGESTTLWVGIGSAATDGSQTSAQRRQATLDAVSGVLEATNEPFDYTGSAGAAATHALFYSASTGGTFYGSKAMTGDATFNAAGTYSITSFAIPATSPT